MRINASHSHEDRGLDAYWTPIEAVQSLIKIESLPSKIWEPACGQGNIVTPLEEAGYKTLASDIQDYGLPATWVTDYFDAYVTNLEGFGIVTNPPFKLAQEFAQKALSEVDYVALFLRLNWLEGTKRKSFFETSDLSRVWVSSRRLPMMHRYGWTGKRSTSNIAFAWFVWDHRTKPRPQGPQIRWFDWKSLEE